MDALDTMVKTTRLVTKYWHLYTGMDKIFHTAPSINHINYLPIRASAALSKGHIWHLTSWVWYGSFS
jgi:hypothetical protein